MIDRSPSQEGRLVNNQKARHFSIYEAFTSTSIKFSGLRMYLDFFSTCYTTFSSGSKMSYRTRGRSPNDGGRPFPSLSSRKRKVVAIFFERSSIPQDEQSIFDGNVLVVHALGQFGEQTL